jgi:hypothetical protein
MVGRARGNLEADLNMETHRLVLLSVDGKLYDSGAQRQTRRRNRWTTGSEEFECRNGANVICRSGWIRSLNRRNSIYRPHPVLNVHMLFSLLFFFIETEVSLRPLHASLGLEHRRVEFGEVERQRANNIVGEKDDTRLSMSAYVL